MACMVVMCLVVDPGDKPAIYSIERLFETLVGVALACGIDILLPYQPMPQAPAIQFFKSLKHQDYLSLPPWDNSQSGKVC